VSTRKCAAIRDLRRRRDRTPGANCRPRERPVTARAPAPHRTPVPFPPRTGSLQPRPPHYCRPPPLNHLPTVLAPNPSSPSSVAHRPYARASLPNPERNASLLPRLPTPPGSGCVVHHHEPAFDEIGQGVADRGASNVGVRQSVRRASPSRRAGVQRREQTRRVVGRVVGRIVCRAYSPVEWTDRGSLHDYVFVQRLHQTRRARRRGFSRVPRRGMTEDVHRHADRSWWPAA